MVPAVGIAIVHVSPTAVRILHRQEKVESRADEIGSEIQSKGA
jgi:hypothetical protein